MTANGKMVTVKAMRKFGASSGYSSSIKRHSFKIIDFEYPVTGYVEQFPAIRTLSQWEYNPLEDLAKTLLLLKKEYRVKFPQSLLEKLDEWIYHLIEISDTYPTVIDSKFLSWASTSSKQLLKTFYEHFTISNLKYHPSRPTKDMVYHILDQAYLRIINEKSAKKLNLVPEMRSGNTVYGELRPSLVSDMISRAGTNICHSQDSIFIDFGSGIGNVCIQVAAMIGCRSIGVELLELPYQLSQLFRQEFLDRLDNAYGFHQWKRDLDSRLELYKGDFLSHPVILAALSSADVILVNNLTFPESLNLKLKQLFLSMKEGSKIISLNNFTPLPRKKPVTFKVDPLYGRKSQNSTASRNIDSHGVSHLSSNLNDLGNILTVEKIPFPEDSVSWTYAAGYYYIHTVSRSSFQERLSSNGIIDTLNY